MDNYKNSTSIIAKRSYYGGRMFIKYNSQTKRYYIGNTASTAVSETNSAITVYDVTQREVKKVARQLTNQGYTEYLPDWTRDHDTYDDIREAGL